MLRLQKCLCSLLHNFFVGGKVSFMLPDPLSSARSTGPALLRLGRLTRRTYTTA